jgi:RecA/RadA recombinase
MCTLKKYSFHFREIYAHDTSSYRDHYSDSETYTKEQALEICKMSIGSGKNLVLIKDMTDLSLDEQIDYVKMVELEFELNLFGEDKMDETELKRLRRKFNIKELLENDN